MTEELAKEKLPFTSTNSVWAIPIPPCDWESFTAICRARGLDYEIEDRTIVSTLVRMESEDYDLYIKMRNRFNEKTNPNDRETGKGS